MLAITAGTLGLLAAACGPGAPQALPPSLAKAPRLNRCGYPAYTKKVTLTWWTWTANPANVIANFRKCYPSIAINNPTVPASSGEYSKLMAAMAAGGGAPDVVQIEYQELPTFFARRDLVNIASVADRYKADFPAWVWRQVSVGSAVYAIPEDIGPMGMAYRPAIFKKYGLPVPTTYAQFAADAVALHKKDPKQYLTYFPVNDGGYLTALLWQAGSNLFTEVSPVSWKVNIDTKTNLKVLDYWYKLAKEGAIYVTSDYTPAWETQLAKGMFASYFIAGWSPTYEIDEYVKTGSQTFAMTHLPDWVAGHQTDSNWGGSSNAVTTQATHPQAAALFAAFINTSKSGLTIDERPATPTGGGRGLFPANIHRASVPQFKAPVPNFPASVNVSFSQYSSHVNNNFTWSPFTEFLYTEMTSEITAAFSGKISVAKALAIIQSTVITSGRVAGYTVSAGK